MDALEVCGKNDSTVTEEVLVTSEKLGSHHLLRY
jgi:hypothetical protein